MMCFLGVVRNKWSHWTFVLIWLEIILIACRCQSTSTDESKTKRNLLDNASNLLTNLLSGGSLGSMPVAEGAVSDLFDRPLFFSLYDWFIEVMLVVSRYYVWIDVVEGSCNEREESSNMSFLRRQREGGTLNPSNTPVLSSHVIILGRKEKIGV